MSQENIDRMSQKWNSTDEKQLAIHLNSYSQYLRKHLNLGLANTVLFEPSNPDIPYALHRMASVFDNQGHYDDALEWYG